MKRPARLPDLLLPALVGLLALALTGWLWRHEQRSLDTSLRLTFDFGVRQATSRIEQRLAAYEQMLRGARGLFEASDQVSAEDFQRYVEALAGGADFAGLQAMLFTPYREDATPATAPITYVAPASAINHRALGIDLYAEPLRRTAMDQARDSGTLAITSRVRLLMDAERSQPGFAMFLATYARGAPADSVAARQASLTGWVHVAFRLHDLMASLYGEGVPGTALRIYDGVAAEPGNLIFDSHPDAPGQSSGRFETFEYISLPQHNWTLQIRSTPEFEARYSRDSARIIAIAGAGLSVLLAMLTWQLVTGRSRAFARAQAMTQELRESEERMRHMAQHDPLTHLPNRALFSDRLHAALARARRDGLPAALMFVDLDHFKPVNDAYGHAMGDRLLIAASARMRDCLRESDTLARMGGDEFVVLLPHIDDHSDAERVAGRIGHALAEVFVLDGHAIGISASIGIGLFPQHGTDEVALMKSADDAMYRAKEHGRDCIVFAAGDTGHATPTRPASAAPPQSRPRSPRETRESG